MAQLRGIDLPVVRLKIFRGLVSRVHFLPELWGEKVATGWHLYRSFLFGDLGSGS